MKEQIIEILNELSEDFGLYHGTDMLKDHILDSFSIMELVASIEEIYEIEIDADDIVVDNFKTVDAIVNLTKKYVGNNL